MKAFIILSFIAGVAFCAPPQIAYYELEYKPVRVVPQAAQAAKVAPAAPLAPSELEILLAAQPAGAPARGFIKHEIPQPAGQESVEVFYPFEFNPAAPAIPAVPAVPAVPVVPAAPVVPAVPVAPAAKSPAPKQDDDDDNDD